jgi:hypothetical protein
LYDDADKKMASSVWLRCQKELYPEFIKFRIHFTGKNWKALNRAWQHMEEIAGEVPEDHNCTKTHFPNLTQENLECGIANLRDVIFKL